MQAKIRCDVEFHMHNAHTPSIKNPPHMIRLRAINSREASQKLKFIMVAIFLTASIDKEAIDGR